MFGLSMNSKIYRKNMNDTKKCLKQKLLYYDINRYY